MYIFYFRLCEIGNKNNYVHYDVVMCFCCLFFGQTASKSNCESYPVFFNQYPTYSIVCFWNGYMA